MAAATKYIVTGPVAVVPTEDGSERYLYRGAIFGKGASEEGIKHLLSVGLIEEAPDPVDEEALAAAVADAAKAAEKATADQAAADKKAAEKKTADDKAAADKAASTPKPGQQ